MGAIEKTLAKRIKFDDALSMFKTSTYSSTDSVSDNSNQKASVLDSVGSWFTLVWQDLINFIKNLFGVKSAGAASSTSLASGSGWCGDVGGSKPNPDLFLYSIESKTGMGSFANFINYYEPTGGKIDNISVTTKIIPGKLATLYDDQKEFLERWDMISGDETGFPEQNKTTKSYNSVHGLDWPTSSPYNCLRFINKIDTHLKEFLYFKSVTVKVDANGQTASRDQEILYFLNDLEKSFGDLVDHWYSIFMAERSS